MSYFWKFIGYLLLVGLLSACGGQRSGWSGGGLLDRGVLGKPEALEHYLAAEVAHENGDVRKAVDEMTAAFDEDDSDTFLALRLAELCIETGDLRRSERLIASVIEDNPRDPDAWLVLSKKHFRTGDGKAAVAAAEQVVRLAPEHVDGSLWLSELAEARGDHDEAKRVLETAARHHPKDGRIAIAQCRLFLAEDNYPAARDTLLSLSALKTVPSALFVALGRAAYRFGRPTEGAEHLERAVASSPSDVTLRLTLVDLYLSIGDLTAAECHLFSVSLPDSASVAQYLAVAERWARGGWLFEARRLLMIAVDAIPGSGTLVSALATVEIRLGRYERAELLLRDSQIEWSETEKACRGALLEAATDNRAGSMTRCGLPEQRLFDVAPVRSPAQETK